MKHDAGCLSSVISGAYKMGIRFYHLNVGQTRGGKDACLPCYNNKSMVEISTHPSTEFLDKLNLTGRVNILGTPIL